MSIYLSHILISCDCLLISLYCLEMRIMERYPSQIYMGADMAVMVKG